MPFVNHEANGPERITHLMDQWKAAHDKFQRIKTPGNELNEEEQKVLTELRNLQHQLLGREECERWNK